MMRKIVPFTLLALAAACAGARRTPDAYRADTRKVLETRSAQIKSCYDGLLANDPSAAGTVTIRFVIEKKTGVFTKATLDPSKTSAKEPLALCVIEAVHGLKLDPPDASEGQATFSYELNPASL